MAISTQDLEHLLDIDNLKLLSQSLAVLDAILCTNWKSRYYSFNAHWATGEFLASMRNGEGDHYFCLFSSVGAILKGFASEAPMSPYRFNPPKIWSGVLDMVSPQFAGLLSEPAFAIEETTFCIWRTYRDMAWQIGEIQFPVGEITDGSAQLLAILDGEPRTYQRWAQDYYGRSISLEAVRAIYGHEPLTDTIVTAINPDPSIYKLRLNIAEIGYNN